MAHEISVPPLGESVTEATIARWMKAEGETVEQDEALVELETDKVTLEVNASASGTLSKIRVTEGETVGVGDILGLIEEGGGTSESSPNSKEAPEKSKKASQGEKSDNDSSNSSQKREEVRASADSQEPNETDSSSDQSPQAASPKRGAADKKANGSDSAKEKLSPAVAKMVAEKGIDPSDVKGTGKEGRLLKEDVIAYEKDSNVRHASNPQIQLDVPVAGEGAQPEERVRMSRLRQRIAERLKEAQNTAAMLTTFNEIDMTNLLAARARYKDSFEKKHNARLGFMSFFTKACLVALKEIPAVNAEIDGTEIIYKNHYDIGIAVSSPQGLVVPVLRSADQLSFSQIEKNITELGKRAKEGKLSMQDLTGGTFTITNGGVFGSLMSTPILNPPQSGILGMHKIQERPMAVNGQVEIRPMMYVALTYDHRLIDGREAVTFLVRVKECIEDPERILLDV